MGCMVIHPDLNLLVAHRLCHSIPLLPGYEASKAKARHHLIYNFSGVPYPNLIGMAWSAALVLVVLVLVSNIITQVVTGRSGRRLRGGD